MNLEKYPNLEAILQGTITGRFSDWPMVKPELERLMAGVDELESENVKLIEERTWLYTVNKKWQDKHEKLFVRVGELETVLKQVRRWGKDSRSVGAWEVFQEVAKVLDPVPEQPVTVVDCTCRPCICPPAVDGDNSCQGCGSRTCLAHELKLKSGGGK